MLLVYTYKINNRIRYIFNLIFHDLLHIELNFTNKISEFIAYDGPKINYSFHQVADEIYFFPANLLFETEIKQQTIKAVDFDGIKCPFPVFKNSCFPFDPFAAAFYLTSRYEEYLPFRRDKYDRFDASESLAFNLGFLKKPVVNIWANKIAAIIHERYPQLVFPPRKYKFLPTIDIDSAWAYKQKGFIRNCAGFLKSLVELNLQEISERIKVITGIEKDPFDTFAFQFELLKRYNLKPIYFILFGEFGQYDKAL